MTNELKSCGRAGCFVNQALKRGFKVLWPQHVSDEPTHNQYMYWAFYIKWEDGTRGHANARKVCWTHHKILVALWSEQTADDIRTEEATEAWLIKHNNQMIVP